MLQLDHRGSSQIAVGVVTVSKGETVDATVTLVVCCSIVQEPANASTPSTVCIDDKSKTIKLAHGVDAGGAHPSLTILCIPKL